MTVKEYRRKTGEWFKGKEATTNKELRNYGGEKIRKGEVVILEGKCGRGGFLIMSKSSGVTISEVSYRDIDFDFSTNK